MSEVLQPRDALDLLFYNFFDLDKYNRGAVGDEVLVLGTRDALFKYLQKKKLVELKEQNPENEGDNPMLERHRFLFADEDGKIVSEMIKEAAKILEMAEYLKTCPSMVSSKLEKSNARLNRIPELDHGLRQEVRTVGRALDAGDEEEGYVELVPCHHEDEEEVC